MLYLNDNDEGTCMYRIALEQDPGKIKKNEYRPRRKYYQLIFKNEKGDRNALIRRTK